MGAGQWAMNASRVDERSRAPHEKILRKFQSAQEADSKRTCAWFSSQILARAGIQSYVNHEDSPSRVRRTTRYRRAFPTETQFETRANFSKSRVVDLLGSSCTMAILFVFETRRSSELQLVISGYLLSLGDQHASRKSRLVLHGSLDLYRHRLEDSTDN